MILFCFVVKVTKIIKHFFNKILLQKMFSNRYCNINKNMREQNDKCNTYFLKLMQDEHKKFETLKEEEKLATAENPRNKFLDETNNICQELKDCKLKEIVEQKRRQQLRENSHELRRLEKQLQTALVSKQLWEQQKNLALQKQEETRIRQEENAKFAEECENIRKTILQQEHEEKQKKTAFRNMLKRQIDDLQQKRRVEVKDALKDKEQIEKLLKRLQEEDTAAHKESELLRERFRMEMEESYRNRELQRQLEKERNEDDMERNIAYQEKCDQLKSQMAAERKRIQKEKELLSEHIGQQLASLQTEKEKRENLLLSLLVEERKAKEDQRYRDNIMKQVKEREKIKIEFEHYRQQIQLQKQKQFKEEEEKFRAERLRHLAELDKLDQLSDEKRRRKKMEHNKALREMIEQRRIQRANQMAERITDFEKMLSGEKEMDRLIEEERIRMLISVPKELLSYLPPGVLKTSDREFLTLPGQKS